MDSNSDKIINWLRPELYGRAEDLCSGISDEQIFTTEVVKSIVDHICQCDALSVVIEVWHKPPKQGGLSAGPKTCPGVDGTESETGEEREGSEGGGRTGSGYGYRVCCVRLRRSVPYR